MVEFLLGKREIIAASEELVAYGTAGTFTSATSHRFGVNARWDPNRNDNSWQEIRGAGSDSIDVLYEVGPKAVGGNLTYTPQDWAMLYFVLGSVATTGASSPYTHTFTNTTTGVPHFTLQRAIQHTTDRVRTYTGCKVNRCTINFNAGAGAGGGFMEAILEILAQGVTNGTTTSSLSAPATAGYQFRNVILTLGGTEITNLTRGSLVIENNLHDSRYANYTLNRAIGEPEPEIRRFSGSFTILPVDDTYFDYWNNAASDISGTNTLVFQRGTNDQITFTFGDIVIGSAPDPTNLEGINEVTLNWKCESITAVAIDATEKYFNH